MFQGKVCVAPRRASTCNVMFFIALSVNCDRTYLNAAHPPITLHTTCRLLFRISHFPLSLLRRRRRFPFISSLPNIIFAEFTIIFTPSFTCAVLIFHGRAMRTLHDCYYYYSNEEKYVFPAAHKHTHTPTHGPHTRAK